MISYDNIDIRSVADVRVEDIRVSSISLSQTERPRTISAGSVFVRNRAAKRTVTVTFALLSDDINARQAALGAINAWAKTDKEYRIELIGHPDHYLTGVCTSKPDPSTRQWWESKLRLVFTCYDNPYWTDKVEKSVACGTAFTVLGDAPPLMRITKTRSSAASNQSYVRDGKTIKFSTVPIGDMTIDLNAETAYVETTGGGITVTTDLMQYYVATSRWFAPKTGAQTITGDGIIRYRERFE